MTSISDEDLKKILVNKKQKSLNRTQLSELTKEELIDKIIQLEAHNLQLKNIIQKKINKSNNISNEGNNKLNNNRKFDFSKAQKRHVLLKFLYFGWDYQGFTTQEDTNDTIEFYVFSALQKTCLIESRETSNYNRCGRTDTNVSAFCQVISIDVRSKFSTDEQMLKENISNEIDYCETLNRVLPVNIKCITWMPLQNSLYSARFDCSQRSYRYFFPRGNLDIEAMRSACKHLIGTNDFRNLCKMDVANGVTNFSRTIMSADIKACDVDEIDNYKGYKMYYFIIVGKAFLWHQIRCIMSVLFLIGENFEDSSIILDLFNVQRNPCKPQYTPTIGIPLNLYSCEFNSKTVQGKSSDLKNATRMENNDTSDTTEWVFRENTLKQLIESVQKEWSLFNIKATMIRECLKDLTEIYDKNFEPRLFKNQICCLQQNIRQKKYQKLLERKRCEALEERVDHYVKKQRLIFKNGPSN